MSYNPIDYLNKNKSASWQELAAGAFSSSNSNKRKRLLGMGILGFLNVRESKMINETQKNLRKLEASKVLEYGKIENQHKQNQEIVDQFESYRKNPLNYFEIEAEAELDKVDPDFWTREGGSIGRTSLTAQETRTNDITGLATSKRNALFSKMGYRTNEDGAYEIDDNTNLPKILTQDDPTTEKVNERDIRRAEILKRKSLAEAQQPYNTYFAAKQEEIMQPKNISWAGKVLDRASSFFRKNKGEPTAIEKDAENLLKDYEESYKKASKSLNLDLVPITVNGKSIYELIDGPKPFLYKKRTASEITFTLSEAQERIYSQSNTDLPLAEKQNISKALKRSKNLYDIDQNNLAAKNNEYKIQEFKINNIDFQALIMSRKENYNAYAEDLGKRLDSYDKNYTKNILDQKTIDVFKSDPIRTIDPESDKQEPYTDGRKWLEDTINMDDRSRQATMGTWNNTQKRIWQTFQLRRGEAGVIFQGVPSDDAARLKNVGILVNKYQANAQVTAYNEEKKAAALVNKTIFEPLPLPYDPSEIKVILNSLVNLTESDISKTIMSRLELELSDVNEAAVRANIFNQNQQVQVWSVTADGGIGGLVSVSSEEDYRKERMATAIFNATQLNENLIGMLELED